jgi:putative transposase
MHIQFVFVVKFRQGLISKAWKDELHKYITGIVQHYDHKMICINSVPDHVHMLVGMRPSQSASDLMKEVKAYSTRWINDRKLVAGKFEWQSGYGGFAYSKRDIPNVIRYIENQEEHHRKKNFKEEYVELLKENEVDYNERFVFQDVA